MLELFDKISVICFDKDDLVAKKVLERLSQFGIAQTNELSEADILLYNYDMDVIEDDLIDDYPNLILAEYSWFGSHTLWSEREGSEAEVQAMSGIAYLSGNRDDAPEVAPLAMSVEFCASYLVQGILVALYNNSGGCKISTSAMEALLTLQADMISTSRNRASQLPVRAKKCNAHAYLSAPYGVYQTLDGYFAMSITPVPRLAEVMGLDIHDGMKPRKGWFDYRDEIIELLAEKFLTKTNQEWLDIFEPLDIWCGVFLSREEILEHEGYRVLGIEGLPYKIDLGSVASRDSHVAPPTRPLEGLMVVDLSQFLSAPSATLQLADLGATVVKIERPEVGESGRDIIFDYTYLDGESSEFLAVNRNKMSFAADLKNPQDLANVIELIKRADILVHNFRPEVIRRLGIDYETIVKLNPKIIYANVSGYGQEGCWVKKPGQDLIVQALAGVATLNGAKQPKPIGAAVVDVIAGVHLLEGILVALCSGRSANVSVTMLGSVMDMQLTETDDYSGEFWDWNDLFYSKYGESLDMLQEVVRSDGYRYLTTRCPIRINNKILTNIGGAPQVGEHTEELMGLTL